jgi:hypothetical protein
MKRFFLTLTLLAALIVSGLHKVSAQCAFPAGTVGINLGLGLGNSDYGYWINNGYHNNHFPVPTFNTAVDYAFLGNIINSNGSISGGGYFGIGGGNEKWKDHKNSDFRFRLGTRGALHYTWVRNLDTYAGIGIGFRQDKYKTKKPNGDTEDWGKYSEFDWYAFAGVRYVMGSFAFFSEVETTNFAFFHVGISFVF